MVRLLWKKVWQFLQKLNVELAYDPAIPLLSIGLKQPKAETDAGSPMLTVLLATA